MRRILPILPLFLLLPPPPSCPVVLVSGLAYAPNFITKIVSSSIESNPTLKRPDYYGGDDDDATTNTGVVCTRFPPEPNGYLHLGHAKAVCFNRAVADMYRGRFHMRLDDTNPAKEDEEYVESILEDVRWILPPPATSSSEDPWSGPVRKTSDYFNLIYDCATSLIQSGDAYVDSLSPDEMRAYRGTLTEPGKDSPYRGRTVEENMKMFEGMRNGEYPSGTHILRAKIDMSSPNLNLRDPPIYRILHGVPHESTGDTWCIYPLYDFSHPIADAVEGITHSLCSLEFEDHRPLYDWVLERLMPTGLIDRRREGGDVGKVAPRQIEFSRLNLKYTVLSKRKLIQLVKNGHVDGWDDPRMPTLSGMRRRGIPPPALRLFCERVGISKSDSNIDFVVLEDCAREVMDKVCMRAFAVVNPLRVTITNWGGGRGDLEDFEVPRHPKDDTMGERTVPFGKHLYIERTDFFDTVGPEGGAAGGKPPKGFKRLVPGGKVRLKYAYVITCDKIIRDPETDEPVELLCTVHPETRGGRPLTPKEGGKKAPRPGIIHWVEQSSATPCTINLYDRLFRSEQPGRGESDGAFDDDDDNSSFEEGVVMDEERTDGDNEAPSFLKDLNPRSLDTLSTAYVEPSVALDSLGLMSHIRKQQQQTEVVGAKKLYHSDLSYQFERNGYFALDPTSDTKRLVFNRVVTLRDTWASGDKRPESAAFAGSSEKRRSRRSRGSGSGSSPASPKMSEGPPPDILRVALRAATIQSVAPHPEADSLIVCQVDCGDDEPSPRTVVAKIPVDVPVIGTRVVCMTNLKPSRMRGIESTAMLLAAVDDNGNVLELLSLDDNVPNGELLNFAQCGESQPDALLKSKGALKVWERVKNALFTNGDGETVYKKGDGVECKLVSSQGPVMLSKSKNASIQ